ncbi:GGDEF domain-containing protein [Ferrovibrio xuzhouensis]|uniref:diguanylate cyclase n=1 Tax=Ferrovibrio xuzhouensis TaxID=1576914 RepID=A0ABV7VBB0_9PROT
MTATDSPAVAAPPPEAASEAETRLYHSATRDSLTGLPNRHYFREAAERALLLAGRQQSPVTVLAVDVDDFDGLIAQHGQPLADAVVQRLAVLLEDRFRRSDLIARLFGASFAVLLPGAGHRNARLLAENLRAAVEADAGADGNGTGDDATLPRITVSVGLAVAAPDNQAALDPLLDLADDALRAAKAAGRNRVTEA